MSYLIKSATAVNRKLLAHKSTQWIEINSINTFFLNAIELINFLSSDILRSQQNFAQSSIFYLTLLFKSNKYVIFFELLNLCAGGPR